VILLSPLGLIELQTTEVRPLVSFRDCAAAAGRRWSDEVFPICNFFEVTQTPEQRFVSSEPSPGPCAGFVRSKCDAELHTALLNSSTKTIRQDAPLNIYQRLSGASVCCVSTFDTF
jgi:hypothetical protein